MRGTKAKRLRNEIYGDISLKIKRQYVGGKHGLHYSGGPKTIINHPDSMRAKYQLAKKEA